MKVMVSACLLGEKCKYNGGDNYSEKLTDYIKDKEVISVCPELDGGLGVPRDPCEIADGRVITSSGDDVDIEFRDGASKCVELAISEDIDLAILQSRSPSCGVNQIYDGSFSGKLIEGSGVFASLLKENGFEVLDISDL